MQKQPQKHAMPVWFRPLTVAGPVIAATLILSACVSTPHRAKEINDLSIAKVCTVFQPVTDTTSSQVRANNRARYVLCNKVEKSK